MVMFKHCCVVMFLICSALKCLGHTEIPSVREYCRFRRNRKLVCDVPADGLLDFREIRILTKNSRRNNIEVYCSEGGMMFLPWPIKAKNLNRFLVKGCLLKGYFSEYKHDYQVPDAMIVLRIIDCTVETNIIDSIKMINKIGQFSKSYDCGQLTVETEIIRNMSYFFIRQPGELDYIKSSGALENAADRLLQESKSINYRCEYTKLRNLDLSISKSRSKFFFQLSTDNEDYPVLRYFNFSDNLLPNLPKELKNWSVNYPALEYLDITNNKIKTFEFVPYNGKQARTVPLYVDMQRNMVKTIPSTVLRLINAKVPVIVDLRNNPINCDCQIIQYRRYLELVSIKYPKYNYLLGVKCASPFALAGKDIVSLKDEILNCPGSINTI